MLTCKKTTLLLACTAATFAAGAASADVVETFPNDTGAVTTFSTIGWEAYLGDAAFDRTSFGPAGNSAPISFNDGIDGAAGYGAKTSTGATSNGLFFTDENGAMAQADIDTLAISANNASTDDLYNFDVRVDGD